MVEYLICQMSPLFFERICCFYIVMRNKEAFLEIMGLYKVWKQRNENRIT